MPDVTCDPDALSEMIGLVYDSALAELQWQDLTDRLHAMFPQACFTMTGFDGLVGMPNLVQSGFTAAERAFYLEKIAPRNEAAKFMSGQPTGKLITQVVSREEFSKTVFYREWLEPRGYGLDAHLVDFAEDLATRTNLTGEGLEDELALVQMTRRRVIASENGVSVAGSVNAGGDVAAYLGFGGSISIGLSKYLANVDARLHRYETLLTKAVKSAA